MFTFYDTLNGFIFIEDNYLHVPNLPKVGISSKNDGTRLIYGIFVNQLEFFPLQTKLTPALED